MPTLTADCLRSYLRQPFAVRVDSASGWPLRAQPPAVLQLNLGYRCNQQCAHCHLEAGTERTEIMSREVMQAALDFAERAGISAFDLTGGAPEMHPHFRWLLEEIHARGGAITDRCNLSILCMPEQEDLLPLFAAYGARIMASLPHFNSELTDRVRGRQVFARSLQALKALNGRGYGLPDSPLELVLVYNPPGAVLPAAQQTLEAEFRRQLAARYGIVFTRLIALTNMPIGRFFYFLQASGNLARYMARLEGQLNPATLPHLMCRTFVSVAWDGTVFDCDFNQALGLSIALDGSTNIRDLSPETLPGRPIQCRNHCYACTAGQGSSCGGAVAEG